MSKSIGKTVGKVFGSITGTNGIKYDDAPATDYANYLAKYDTSKVDNTLSNLQNYALTQSQNLGNMTYQMPTINASEWNIPNVSEKDWYMPEVSRSDYVSPTVNRNDWTYSVDASEKARQQAQDATYNSYMDKLNPQFEQQTADYATMLQNKGIPIGSEAYSRAMSDLQDRQNAAVNQAAYQSVLAGQNAYSQSLADQISAGNFGNNAVNSYYNTTLAANQAQNQAQNDYLNAMLAANQNQAAFYDAQQTANNARASLIDAQNAVNNSQAAYLAQIMAALGDAPSQYDIQGDIYAARANNAANQYNAKQQTATNRANFVNSLLGAGAKMLGGAAGAGGAA